ncbi:MAG: hypothetical protein COS34_08850, partial [Lysobacterales bacterium CG02_land_8_20_14_3_00_62_12]
MVGNWNPDGSGGIYNNHPDSLSYSSVLGRWSLRQEDLQPFSASAAFNLFVPAHGTGRYQHLNTPGNVSGALTTLNQTDLNGHGDAIVLATRNPGSGTITDLAAPLAVTYFGPNWTVARLDGLSMPSNGGFNVSVRPRPSSGRLRSLLNWLWCWSAGSS